MGLLPFILRLTPHAFATNLEKIGATGPGVSGMWQSICSVMLCNGGKTTAVVFAGIIVKFLVDLIGGVAAAVVLYGAIRMIMSQGKDEAFAEGRKIIIYALLGVALAMISDLVIQYAISVLQQAAV